MYLSRANAGLCGDISDRAADLGRVEYGRIARAASEPRLSLRILVAVGSVL